MRYPGLFGFIAPDNNEKVVLFPHPLRPAIPIISPSTNLNDTDVTATWFLPIKMRCPL